ncbi:MAG: cytochrome c oxidase subunit II [Gemmatimonadaceae bacterium]
MIGSDRLRRIASYALSAALVIAVVACSESHPNSTLVPRSDFGREIDFLWDRMLLIGTIVFVLTEGALLYVVLKYRRRENQPPPPQTHGSTKLEITWTLIPAVILVFIAVPTVRTIVTTQAAAAPGALNIDVIGHQWWWEFRYADHGITTANEIYIPAGRTVNFRLRSADVIHSFWAPQLGGKRDVVTNRTNYLWLTPDSATASMVWNGFCAEYCGTAHTYMRFRVFTVTPQEFDSWAAGQKMPARFGAVGPPAPTGGPIPPPLEAPGITTPTGPGAPSPAAQAAAPQTPAFATATGAMEPGYIFPRNRIPDYAVPSAPIPDELSFTAGLTGNAHRGRQIFSSKTCIGCHSIAGNPAAMGVLGPNLTHFGSRSTIAAGLYPNTPAYLALWIKNARAMKPGALMPALGLNEYDPTLKSTVTAATGGLTDQEIADIVAYLTTLK